MSANQSQSVTAAAAAAIALLLLAATPAARADQPAGNTGTAPASPPNPSSSSAAASSGAAATTAPRVAFQRGTEAFKRGDLDTALREMEEAVQVNANDAEALGWLGFLLLRKNDPERAIGYLERSAQLRPDVAGTHINLGNAYVQRKQTDRAIESFRQAVQINDQPPKRPKRSAVRARR
jgi:Flp pilus assembly protein TadD